MLTTIRTLFLGERARAEEAVRRTYSVELIEQKIREAEGGLQAAKATLASLIQRQRSETRQLAALEARAADLTVRARAALAAGNDTLAGEAAEAIAEMENESALRAETVAQLDARILRLRQSVETTNRRIIDLKQGAVAARAVRQERAIQTRIRTTLSGRSPMDEADALIAEVLTRDEPQEEAEILREIDRGLTKEDLTGRMAAEGFGKPLKVTAVEILTRLRADD
ncbi:PspA/IM30 family protein [Defluviimonas sp. SAOS-178_SWC]|uniref:PspA/IM30 family protein n=1 Tax=Defluviimonas sp. SAOS-178_SWC TaxID=3121287 RepID=UPI0032219B82